MTPLPGDLPIEVAVGRIARIDVEHRRDLDGDDADDVRVGHTGR